MQCAITGANGYLGSLFVNVLRQRGHAVYELRRDGADFANEFRIPYSLEMKLDSSFLKDMDVLIHCAYDFRQLSWDKIRKVNVDGSKRLFQAAAKAALKKIILISTMSAFDGCKSMYGTAKINIEKAAENLNADIVRPGLIYGASPGGFVGILIKLIKKFSVAPIFNGGNQKLYMTHESDLCELIHELTLTPKQMGIISAVCRDAMTFKSILKKLADYENKKLFLIPLPWRLVYVGIKTLEMMGLRMGLRSDSLISLLNQNPNPDFETMCALRTSFRPFE